MRKGVVLLYQVYGQVRKGFLELPLVFVLE